MQPNDPQPAFPTPLSPLPAVLTVPVIEESVRVDKEVVETGRVVIRKTVHQDTQTVRVPLQADQVHVERVPVNRVVESPPEVRHEGDTMIIPVLREEVVVTTRLVLVEELHVRKQALTTNYTEEVALRREEIHYERLEESPGSPLS